VGLEKSKGIVMASNDQLSGNGGEAARSKATASRLKQTASEVTEKATVKGKQKLEQGKNAAAAQAERIGNAIERAAEQLDDGDGTLTGYAQKLAGGMQRMAETLRTRSIDDITADVQSLARRNPTAFILGSVAVGVALGRFLRASPERSAFAADQNAGFDDVTGDYVGE
jgi:hypothetical protein